jgi:hypothetical protein
MYKEKKHQGMQGETKRDTTDQSLEQNSNELFCFFENKTAMNFVVCCWCQAGARVGLFIHY